MTEKLTYEELEERIKELELLESYHRSKQSLILDAIDDGFWEHDFRNNTFQSSDRLFTMLGYSPINGMEGYEFLVSKIHPEDKKTFEHEQQQFITGSKTSSQFDFRLQAADGSWRSILSRGNCIASDENGAGYHYLGTHTDITWHKQIAEELRVSVIKHKTILEVLPVGVTVSDDAENIVESNSTAQKLLGLSREEHLKRKIQGNEWSIIREDGSPMPSDEFASVRALKERALVENVVMGIVKEGNEVTWISVSSAPVPLEGYGVAISFSDITERKRAEDALRESEARFKALHNASFGGIGIHDKGVILDCNQGLSAMTGYSVSELTGMDGLLLIAEKSREFVMQNILSGYEKPYESVGLRKNGEEYPLRLEARNIPYRGNSVRVVEFRDITEKKQAEIKQQELEATNLRLQKAESLAQMAGGIAHLFNNYLYAVSGNLELALDDLPEESLIREKLIAAMRAARRCSDVSGSMLTYLGQSFVKIESIDISEFCRKHLPNLQSSLNANISIETELSDRELLVRANGGQMQQVLNHLITNGCESIGEKQGRISLVTKTMPATDISELHLFPVDSRPSADTYACLEVTDTGCGIPLVDIDRLFDPFFTTKFAGRGLGLAVVSGIVKAWGGMIGVRSKVGHGSTFMVFIPLSAENSVLQTEKLSQSPQVDACSTVLLVEDHEMVRNITTAMLKRMGFEVISALNGVEAVELFRKHKESVSCLITDLSMPELDGWGTLAEIRKIKPGIPAILASGYDESSAMSCDDSEKPQAFLHKPYSMKELRSALGQAMNSLATVN